MDTLLRDVRYAIRTLRRTPTFTTVALLSLALGIGANTTVFSLVNAVHFSTLPFPDADRLMLVDETDARPGCTKGCTRRTTYAEFRQWAGSAAHVDDVAAYQPARSVLVDAQGADVIDGAAVSSAFLPLLGLHAQAGRALAASDEAADAEDVAMIGDDLWRHRFGQDPSVIGRTIRLDQRNHVIVGVLAATPHVGRPLVPTTAPSAAFLVPLKPRPGVLASGDPRLSILMRAPDDGATLVALLSPLVNADLVTSSTTTHVWTPRTTSLRDALATTYRSSYWTLFGAVAFVLFIACVNLAGLFATRLSNRRRDFAIQAALGASRGRLVQEMITEVVVIAVAGGALGLVVTVWGTALARHLPAEQIPFWNAFTIDGRVLLFTAALTLVTTILFGLWPAVSCSRGSLQQSLRDVGGSSVIRGGRSRARAGLVALEIACTVMLLTGAGLLAKTFVEAEQRNLGMSRYDVVEAHVSLPDARYGTGDVRLQFARDVMDQLIHAPGVLSVAVLGRAAKSPPPGITVEGQSEAAPNSTLSFGAWDVTPDYFRTAGIAMIAGRAFEPADRAGTIAVTILDEPTAQHLFPNAPSIGKRIKLGPPSSPEPWLTVIGVTATAHGDPLQQKREYFPVLYRALAQFPQPSLAISARTNGDPHVAIPPMRAAVKALDATLPLTGVQTVNDAFGEWLWPLRFNTMMMSGFAVFAVVLAAIGVYGVMAYLVAQRTREVGIRVALGADRRAVLWLVMRSGLVMAGAGIIAGVIGALALTRVLQALLYGASTTDPVVFVTASLVLLGVAGIATYIPARRALGVSPLVALRPE